MRKLVLTLGLIVAAAAGAVAQEPGDPQKGAQLAQTWCASCHFIAAGEPQTILADVPSFAEIAKTLDEERRERLALWPTEPHGGMPDLSLTQPEIADLLAYIESLAPKD
ncbi:MAG TPA: c-type cytochrome [Hyphomicrobiales bacterium]|nr:c-type cytochrome [Hyphomicrobiales bacterium]